MTMQELFLNKVVARNPEAWRPLASAATPAQTTPAQTPSGSAGTGQTGTGWGWSNPNGGEAAFTYQRPDSWTDNSWAQNTEGTVGYRPSVKEVTMRILAENGLDPQTATPEQVIPLLQRYGINANSPAPGQIDFGLGEGPIQLQGWRTLGNTNPNGGGGFSTQGVNGQSFSAPGLLAPWTDGFTPPSHDDVMNSPAVQARLKMGTEALQRSSAARGTLLTGGAMKDLNAFAQNVASQEYGNEWNRQFQGAGFNRDTFWGNQSNAFNKLAGFTQIGQAGAGQLGGYGSGYADTTGRNAAASGGLDTGQANANAAAGLAQDQNAANTGTSVANAAMAGIDWSRLFKRTPNTGAGFRPQPVTGATSAPANLVR